MPIPDGLRIVDRILESNCKYLMSTTFLNIKGKETNLDRENVGVEYGRFYPVNLTTKPFNFPRPDYFITEDVMVDGYEDGNRKSVSIMESRRGKKMESGNSFLKFN